MGKERARLVISPRSISQLRDSISQTVAFDRLLPKSLLFLGKSFSLSSRKEEEANQMVSISHPKSSNRRRYFPSSYRLTGPKWNFPPPLAQVSTSSQSICQKSENK
jgi:hypothetical protein